jgi:hypothetical protein
VLLAHKYKIAEITISSQQNAIFATSQFKDFFVAALRETALVCCNHIMA